MPTTKINFKNIELIVNNQCELYIKCDLFSGSKRIGTGKAVVNMINKNADEIKQEAMIMLANSAKQVLETKPLIVNKPDSIANYSQEIEYEENN